VDLAAVVGFLCLARGDHKEHKLLLEYFYDDDFIKCLIKAEDQLLTLEHEVDLQTLGFLIASNMM
jgi:hypothetical protein